MNLTFLTQFIDASKVGGWVRSGVAVGFGILVAKWPGLSTYIDPATQAAIGGIVATVVMGVWSQLTKTDNAKLAAVEAMPDVAQVVPKVTAAPDSAVAQAAADPSRPKVST